VNYEAFSKALANAQPYHPPDLPDISLVRLLADPEPYDEKIVRVRGFLDLEFEGTALYLHREDCEQMLSKNALWLHVTAEIWEREYELTERYVLVIGVFRAHNHGHMNLFSGAITNIQDIRPISSREEIRAFLDRERNKR